MYVCTYVCYQDRFGTELGWKVWQDINQSFDRLPLAAVIDYDIFCIHGGIPRPISQYDTSINAILSVPCVAAVSPFYDHESIWTRQV